MVLDNRSQCVNGIFRDFYCCYKGEKIIILMSPHDLRYIFKQISPPDRQAIIPPLEMISQPQEQLNPLELVSQQSPYFRLLKDHGETTRQALD